MLKKKDVIARQGQTGERELTKTTERDTGKNPAGRQPDVPVGMDFSG